MVPFRCAHVVSAKRFRRAKQNGDGTESVPKFVAARTMLGRKESRVFFSLSTSLGRQRRVCQQAASGQQPH